MDAVKSANLAVRFLLELCALAALGYWGAKAGSSTATRVVLAIGMPLAAAVLWGLFAAPKAVLDAGPVVRWGVELLVFAAATAGLVATRQRLLAVVLVVVYVGNRFLMAIWDQ